MGKIHGKILKDIIDKSGMSESEWAKQHGFTQRALNSWITGERNCLLKNAQKLAHECNCSLGCISTYSLNDVIDDLEDRMGFIKKLDDCEYAELVNAYEEKRLDLSQIAKIDDIENFRERAILGISKMDIPADAKGKVVSFLSDLKQMGKNN